MARGRGDLNWDTSRCDQALPRYAILQECMAEDWMQTQTRSLSTPILPAYLPQKNASFLNTSTPFSFGYNSHISKEPSATKLLRTLSLSILKTDPISL